ncbi:RNA polymerase sigma factor [Sphingobium sp. BYY-5]|uniref:RNA polymerase sigma factor n=1 Tax=Sphingobium sp. BYY-5 TaxID=2926400 RepID=UPI001FA7DD0E|nr:RNA polymerase sigma factor [Sphingobium sp. BYY-5]MCI4589463.1 RNA polymerase sigma factor [Sphingobium sp. BYY-5]
MCSERVDQQDMATGGLLGVFIASRPALLRYLMLRGAVAEEAEDILQEIYLKLSVDRIGPVAEPRAYLYRMTNNHFLGHRRAAGRRIRREEDWVDVHSGEEREVDERPSAEAQLIAREQLAILQRVLDGLPERTRTIFRRFRIENEPQRQIAADIGISVSAVEKHLTRAYEAIAAAKLRLDGDRGDPRHLRGERGRHGI